MVCAMWCGVSLLLLRIIYYCRGVMWGVYVTFARFG